MRELATLLMTQLLRQLHIHISAYTSVRTFTVVPAMLNHHVSSSHHLLSTRRATRQCAYASSGCHKKKITLYRNFFKRLSHARNFFNVMLTGGTWLIHSLTLRKFSRVYDACLRFLHKTLRTHGTTLPKFPSVQNVLNVRNCS